MNGKKKTLQYLLLISIAICAVLSVSYAYFAMEDNRTVNSKIAISDAYGFVVSSSDTIINLSGDFATPITDGKALSSIAYRYEFSVTNPLSSDSDLKILLAPSVNNTMPLHAVKYAIYEQTEASPALGERLTNHSYDFTAKEKAEINNRINETINTGYTIVDNSINANETKSYYLYVWIDLDVVNNAGVDVSNKNLVLHLITLPQGFANLSSAVMSMASAVDGASVVNDHGYRYVGRNPNNYIEFNNELWRIIGVFDTEYDTDGDNIPDTVAPLTKIIRLEFLGKNSFDNKKSGVGSSIYQYGSNDWSDSQLMMMLNPPEFINTGYKKDGTLAYNNVLVNEYVQTSGGIKIFKNPGSYMSNSTVYLPAQATTTTLTETEGTLSGKLLTDLDKIATVRWNIGGADTLTFYSGSANAKLCSGYNADAFYACEQNGLVGIETRASYWYGMVGLMYASDYGYATGGKTTSTYSRENCLRNNSNDSASALVNYHNNNCNSNDWLNYWIKYPTQDYNEILFEWTMTPVEEPRFSYEMFTICNRQGGIYAKYTNNSYYYRPVVYLKPGVIISGGTGSETDPYTLMDGSGYTGYVYEKNQLELDINMSIVPSSGYKWVLHDISSNKDLYVYDTYELCSERLIALRQNKLSYYTFNATSHICVYKYVDYAGISEYKTSLSDFVNSPMTIYCAGSTGDTCSNALGSYYLQPQPCEVVENTTCTSSQAVVEDIMYLRHQVENNIIKKTDACIYHNNHEFCAVHFYSVNNEDLGDLATRLRADMINAIGESPGCGTYDYTWCEYDNVGFTISPDDYEDASLSVKKNGSNYGAGQCTVYKAGNSQCSYW